MELPFTVEQFLSVFESYNRAIGPAPVVAYALGGVALVLACRGGERASRAVLAVLALLWAFVGAVYHLGFFRPVNPAAAVFGAVFLVQGVLLAASAARSPPLPFRLGRRPRHALALAFAAYAMIGYPLLGAALGHAYPRAPVFGVAPCPMTIFTFALLLLAEAPVPIPLLAIPFAWSLLGFSAAAQLGMREDYGLAVAGIVGTIVLVAGRRRAERSRPAVAHRA